MAWLDRWRRRVAPDARVMTSSSAARAPVGAASQVEDEPSTGTSIDGPSTAAISTSTSAQIDDDLEAPRFTAPSLLPVDQASRVIFFAPHPDDESISCGGTLLRLLDAGAAVHVVLVSDGSGAGELPEGTAEIRQQEFRAALAVMGVRSSALLGFPDGALALDGPLLDAMRHEVEAFSPRWIFTPDPADPHRDHRVVAEAARRAANGHAAVERLCYYESWAALAITHVVDIGSTVDRKMAALAEHHTALACGNYSVASLGLAQYRGLLLGRRGVDVVAEGFRCVDRLAGDEGFPRESRARAS